MSIYIPVMMTTLSWTRGLLEPAATLAMGRRSWEVRASMRFSAFDLSDMMGGLCVCYEGVEVKMYKRWTMADISVFQGCKNREEKNKENVIRWLCLSKILHGDATPRLELSPGFYIRGRWA